LRICSHGVALKFRNPKSEILLAGEQNETQRTNNHSFDLRLVTVRLSAWLQDAGQEESWQAVEQQ
jgi:hypothetical protein